MVNPTFASPVMYREFLNDISEYIMDSYMLHPTGYAEFIEYVLPNEIDFLLNKYVSDEDRVFLRMSGKDLYNDVAEWIKINSEIF